MSKCGWSKNLSFRIKKSSKFSALLAPAKTIILKLSLIDLVVSAEPCSAAMIHMHNKTLKNYLFLSSCYFSKQNTDQHLISISEVTVVEFFS